MNKLYHAEKFWDIKSSPLNQNLMGVLSNRDIQIFRFEHDQYKLQQKIDIGKVTTFEWQKCASKNQHGQQYLLAAHQNGKISLINYHPRPQSLTQKPRVEKVFVTSEMVQNSRHCNALAWNPLNPKLFAAGYDQGSMNDSSLMIWDIEKSMNEYLN